MTNWENIIMSILGALLTGDILMRIFFKSYRRMDDAKAESAEIQADTDEWHRYKEELERYDDIVKSLQDTIKTQVEQIGDLIKDHATERAELEVRFNNQTDRLRETQRELVASNEREVNYVKRIGELELELEKKRCDDLPCPFRLPPNAHTLPMTGEDKKKYFENRDKQTKE